MVTYCILCTVHLSTEPYSREENQTLTQLPCRNKVQMNMAGNNDCADEGYSFFASNTAPTYVDFTGNTGLNCNTGLSNENDRKDFIEGISGAGMNNDEEMMVDLRTMQIFTPNRDSNLNSTTITGSLEELLSWQKF